MADTIFRRKLPVWGITDQAESAEADTNQTLSHSVAFCRTGLRRFRSGCIKLKSRTQKLLLQEGHWKHKSQQESFVCCYAMQCYAMLCNVMALHMISCSQKRFIVWKSVMVSWSPLTSLPRYTKFVSASEISSAPGRKHWFLVWSLRQELKAQPDSIDEEARNQAKSGSKKNDTWDLQRWGACIMPRDSLLFPWGPWCRTGEVDDVALFVELASERILVSRRWIDCHSLPFIAIHCHLLPLPVPCQNCSLAPGDS